MVLAAALLLVVSFAQFPEKIFSESSSESPLWTAASIREASESREDPDMNMMTRRLNALERDIAAAAGKSDCFVHTTVISHIGASTERPLNLREAALEAEVVQGKISRIEPGVFRNIDYFPIVEITTTTGDIIYILYPSTDSLFGATYVCRRDPRFEHVAALGEEVLLLLRKPSLSQFHPLYYLEPHDIVFASPEGRLSLGDGSTDLIPASARTIEDLVAILAEPASVAAEN